MSNASASNTRSQSASRGKPSDPYQYSTAQSSPAGPHGPSWGLFNTLVTIGMGIIIALVTAVYLNIKEDIKNLKDDGKDLRSAQSQTSRDISDLRVLTTRIGSQVDQIIQKLTFSNSK